MLIYGIAETTKLSYITSAFFLNGLFSLISVLVFVSIVQLLGGTRRVLWLAAATILLAHEFNAVREYVIRDHGFWAFYLLSIACLIRFFRTTQWRDALLWLATLVMATLFRVEGVIFILLMPFSALFYTKNRLRLFLQLNTMTIVVSVGLAIYIFIHHGVVYEGRLAEIQYQFLHGVSALLENFHAKANALGTYVLSVFSARDANVVLVLLLAVWYIVSVMTNLSLIYSGLVGYAWWNKLLSTDKAGRIVLWGYILINVVITAAFLINFMFLSKRYLIALSLPLMLWVPFALDHLIKQHYQRRWLLPVIILCMLASALGGIFDFGYSKTYIRDAGLWLRNNTAANATICSNDFQAMFYSDHLGNTIFDKKSVFSDVSLLTQGKWQQCDYVALHTNAKQYDGPVNALITEIQTKSQSTQVFANKRGDKVVIYKVSR